MRPRTQLTVSVALVATLVIVLWAVLFRAHLLTPQRADRSGRTLSELSRELDAQAASFEAQMDAYQKRAAPPAAPAQASGEPTRGAGEGSSQE